MIICFHSDVYICTMSCILCVCMYTHIAMETGNHSCMCTCTCVMVQCVCNMCCTHTVQRDVHACTMYTFPSSGKIMDIMLTNNNYTMELARIGYTLANITEWLV